MEDEREGPGFPSFSSVLSPESGLSSVGVRLVLHSCFIVFLDGKVSSTPKLSNNAQLEPSLPFCDVLYVDFGDIHVSLPLLTESPAVSTG